MSYLLRLVVPDRPGILGAVATALGTAGVDIVSVDVLERGGGVAVRRADGHGRDTRAGAAHDDGTVPGTDVTPPVCLRDRIVG